MDVLIDSSILIDVERGQLDLMEHVSGRDEDDFHVSVITASELLHGVFRARTPEQHTRRNAFVEGILARFPLLNVDLETARSHAQLWVELAAGGELIGPHDLWLAATCLRHGIAMATANVREFERVPGLTVEVWR